VTLPLQRVMVIMKTDTELQQDVLAELKWEPSINAAQIGVEVQDGIVTLSGHVDTFAQKGDAEHAAQRVSGVKALAVEIKVKLFGDNQRLDADIARAAENVIEWLTYYPKGSIQVMVEEGWITLSGQVNWEFQRQGIAAAVRHLMGVKGLSNEISIQPKLTPAIVKSDIEAALKRNHQLDGHITVAVEGDEVTLAGTIHSWAERDTARHSAWSTPGVRSVIDKMRVDW